MSRHMEFLSCRFHPGSELIEDSRAGDMICTECGRVVGERLIDVGSEWRTFNNESDSVDKSRVGAADNLLYGFNNLETTTSFVPKRTVGSVAPSRFDNKIRQISSAEKALKEGRAAIQAVASRIHLYGKVIDRAFTIYKMCYEKQYLRGRSQEAIVATCVYVACRQEGSSRTVDEICSITSVSSKEINRTYAKLLKVLPRELAPPSTGISEIIPRFCSRLSLADKQIIQRAAIHIAEQAKRICNVEGRKPSTIAAASIYLACLAADERVSKKDISQATSASELTIREVYRLLLPHAAQLFPIDFRFERAITSLPSA